MRETLGTALQERGAAIEELHHIHKSGEILSLLDIILQKIQEGHTESPHKRNTVTRHMKNTGGKAGTDLSRNMQPNFTTHG